MTTQIRATLILCDHAEVADGKLFINGGGWSLTGPQPTPHGVAALIHVPWDRANDQVTFQLTLRDEEGHPVMQPGPVGPVPVQAGGKFEVGRPPGLKHGTRIDVPFAINVGPVPLSPGGRYEWTLEVDGETDEDWHLGFSVRPMP